MSDVLAQQSQPADNARDRATPPRPMHSAGSPSSVPARYRPLPYASASDTTAILAVAGGPLVAKGLVIRRPKVVGLLRATGAERGGVRLLQAMRRKYGDGPVLLRIGRRVQAVILAHKHVPEVLERTPEPFEVDSSEKHAALEHFQPEGVLISRGPERAARRRLNETALETACPVHSLGIYFREIVEREVAALLADSESSGKLAWKAFKAAWFRAVLSIVFGADARSDTSLLKQLEKLRSRANWAFLKPKRPGLREQVLDAIRAHIEHARPESLAAMTAGRPDAADQIAHWLFAFDSAAIAIFRTLAVLSLHPEAERQARAEAVEDRDGALPFLHACVLDAVRLWPTTPAILRQTDRETHLGGGVLPAGAGVLLHLPYLHRDDSRIPFADRFVPHIWMNGEAERWHFVPFSGGPAECPAKNLVLMLSSLTLATLLRAGRFEMPAGSKFMPSRLPATFDQFSMSLDIVR